MGAMIFNGSRWEAFGGGGGGIDLLWTNPNPGSNFASQTISLDLTEYKGVLVEFRYNTSGTTCVTSFTSKDQIDMAAFHFTNAIASATSAVTLLRRTFSCNNAGVVFGSANTKPLTATAGSTNNTYLIPLTIWGLK